VSAPNIPHTRLFVLRAACDSRNDLGNQKSTASSINKARVSARRLCGCSIHIVLYSTIILEERIASSAQAVFLLCIFAVINKPRLSALPIVMKITTPYHYNCGVCALSTQTQIVQSLTELTLLTPISIQSGHTLEEKFMAGRPGK